MRLCFAIAGFCCSIFSQAQVLVPVAIPDRKAISDIKLTSIGKFGLPRKARREVAAHLHAGIDIMRPRNNYSDEPIFPIATGKVISVRDDGAFAQIIIEHTINDKTFWSVYEHIAGISVKLGEVVTQQDRIARFMNREELEKFGKQFDHVHLEILKIRPAELAKDPKLPARRFNSYSLLCRSEEELDYYFYNPIPFLKKNIR